MMRLQLESMQISLRGVSSQMVLLLFVFQLFSMLFLVHSFKIQPSTSHRIIDTALTGIVSRNWLKDDKSHKENYGMPPVDERQEFGANDSPGFETEPEWLELFPPQGRNSVPEIEREYPDYPSLAPDDPLFIDMPWPSEAGPEASAFGRHMQWRRGLTDGERRRWQQWAIYHRMMKKHHFGYCLEDFIFQNMLRDLYQRAATAKEMGFVTEESMWRALALKNKDEQETEVRAVIQSLYSAFNRKNYDELRTLWLPDDCVELILPGCEKARGANDVLKLYRQVIKDSRPFGSVDAKVVSVNSNGFVAVVQTIEIVNSGTELKVLKKKSAIAPPSTKPPAPKRILATTVLRKWNQQWRIVIHHAVRFTSSPFTGDQLSLSMPKSTKKLPLSTSTTVNGMNPVSNNKEREKVEKEERILKEMSRLGLPPMSTAELDGLLKGGVGTVSTVSRLNKDGVWEKVVSVNDDTREELGKMNWMSKQLTSDTNVDESDEDGSRRIRLGSDGNLYLDDKLYGTTSDKEKAVLRSITGMLGKGNGGSDNTSRFREITSKFPIDPQASISKQTIQALRYLFKAGQITREYKELLVLDIIEHVAREETSLLVVAYELLVVKAKDSNQQTRPWSQALVGDKMSNIQSNGDGNSSISSAGLEEFADQCRALALTMSNRQHSSENDDEDEDDDDDDDEMEDYDDDDEEDEEEREEEQSDRRRGKREPRIVIDDFDT